MNNIGRYVELRIFFFQFVIKKTVNNLSLPLSIIFNKCFSMEEFPMSYKKSIVTYQYQKMLTLNTVPTKEQ